MTDGCTDASTDPKGPGDWCRADVLTLHFNSFGSCRDESATGATCALSCLSNPHHCVCLETAARKMRGKNSITVETVWPVWRIAGVKTWMHVRVASQIGCARVAGVPSLIKTPAQTRSPVKTKHPVTARKNGRFA